MEDLEYDMDIGATLAEDPAPRAADPMDDAFDDVSAAGDILDDDEEDDLAEVPAQSLDEVIDELHEDEELEEVPAIQPRPSEQLKQPVGKVLSAIALQGISSHAKKRPISALDEGWLRTTWERITGLLSDQPDADEAADWKHDVHLLECEADLRDVDLYTPVGAPAPSNEELGRIARGEDGADAAIDAAIERADTVAVVMSLPIGDVAPDPAQARDEGADDELADSIKANGFYSSKPIEVRAHPQAGQNRWPENPNVRGRPDYLYPAYMIVDGERRYRGAVKAGLTQVPVIVTGAAADEGERLLRQVVSNEGKRLKPMEEARTYQRIMTAKGWNIQQLADHLGKSKSTVSDRVAMAEAPAAFQPLFEDGTLSAAAGPVVRKYAHLPEKVLAILVERAGADYGFREHTERGKTVPLKSVENTLERALMFTFPEVGKDFEYAGETITVGKKTYAVERQDYFTARDKHHRAEAQVDAPSAKQREKERKARAEADRRQEAAREKEARDRLLRAAQARAVVAKAPKVVDAAWAMILIKIVLEDINAAEGLRIDDLDVFGLAAPKKKQTGFDLARLVAQHAKTLRGADRIRLLLQLAAYRPEKPWSKEHDYLIEAAKIVKVDLKKVKPMIVHEPTASLKTVKARR